ncbi:MAG TPA: AraC family transcriptional regulator [Kofleriaceae bacterium]|nr:AraC family transcriptional regulator [Kofleriaceae bacterium]
MRTESTGTLSVLAVRTIAMGAARGGLPPAELCARFGIDPALLADADARVPVSDVIALWQEVPRLVGDEDFGLHLAELAAAAPQGLGGQLIAASPTLGDGLRRVLRFERVFHDVRTSELVLEGDEAAIVHDTRGGLALPRHAAEFGWAWLVLIARRVTGAALAPRRASFGHPAPRRIAEHTRVLGVAPSFGAEVPRLTLARADLDRATTTADAALAEILDSHARTLLAQLPTAPELIAQVRAAALRALAEGELSVAAVARHLGVAPRTLQRRLADLHGASFQAVVDDLRAGLARQWLGEHTRPVAEVAFALGFADQSAFHRAFVRWTGMTPGQFRHKPRA